MKKNIVIAFLSTALVISIGLNIYLCKTNSDVMNDISYLSEEIKNLKITYEEQLNTANTKLLESETTVEALDVTVKKIEEEKRAQMEAQQRAEAERKAAEEAARRAAEEEAARRNQPGGNTAGHGQSEQDHSSSSGGSGRNSGRGFGGSITGGTGNETKYDF